MECLRYLTARFFYMETLHSPQPCDGAAAATPASRLTAECRQRALLDEEQALVDRRMLAVYHAVDRLVHLTTMKELFLRTRMFSPGDPLLSAIGEVIRVLAKRLETKMGLRLLVVDELRSIQDAVRKDKGDREATTASFELLGALSRKRDAALADGALLEDAYGRHVVQLHRALLGVVKFINDSLNGAAPGAECAGAGVTDRWQRVLASDSGDRRAKLDLYLVCVVAMARFVVFDMEFHPGVTSEDRRGFLRNLVFERTCPLLSPDRCPAAAPVHATKDPSILSALEPNSRFQILLRLQLSLLFLYKFSLVCPESDPCRAFVKLVQREMERERPAYLRVAYPAKWECAPKALVERYILLFSQLQKALEVTGRPDLPHLQQWEKGAFRAVARHVLLTPLSSMLGIYRMLVCTWLWKPNFVQSQSGTLKESIEFLSSRKLPALILELDYILNFLRSEGGDQRLQATFAEVSTLLVDLRSALCARVKGKGRANCGVCSVGNRERKFAKNAGFLGSLLPDTIPDSEKHNAISGQGMTLTDLLEVTSKVFYMVAAYQVFVVVKALPLHDPLMVKIATCVESLIEYACKRNCVPSLERWKPRSLDVERFVLYFNRINKYISVKKVDGSSFGSTCFPDGNGREALFKLLAVAQETLKLYRGFQPYGSRNESHGFKEDEYHVIMQTLVMILKKIFRKRRNLDKECRESIQILYRRLLRHRRSNVRFHVSTWAKYIEDRIGERKRKAETDSSSLIETRDYE